NELEFCKPQHHGILKARKKHSDEPDRFKIRNITNLSFEIGNRNAKQVPFFWCTSARREGSYIRDEVLSHDIELLGTEIHLVLEIFFQFIQRIVTIEFFLVGIQRKRAHKLVARGRYGRIALWAIDMFISFQ